MRHNAGYPIQVSGEAPGVTLSAVTPVRLLVLQSCRICNTLNL